MIADFDGPVRDTDQTICQEALKIRTILSMIRDDIKYSGPRKTHIGSDEVQKVLNALNLLEGIADGTQEIKDRPKVLCPDCLGKGYVIFILGRNESCAKCFGTGLGQSEIQKIVTEKVKPLSVPEKSFEYSKKIPEPDNKLIVGRYDPGYDTAYTDAKYCGFKP